MRATDIHDPATFHRVVDCQWACPAHTPVPEYIRLIAQRRYDEAYMVNWASNVFPGILGRTCDRPCEPACRRGRVEEGNENGEAHKPEPVAICRLKRVAADFKGDEVRAMMPRPLARNGKRVACVGAGPASLTVARDLAAQGYAVTVFDAEAKAGGFIRTQIPRFRLPESVIDEEVGYVMSLGVTLRAGERIASMKALLSEGYDAVFVGCVRHAGVICRCRGGKKHQRTSTSALIGWLRFPLDTSPAWASASSFWVAATRPWTAAAQPAAWGQTRSRWWCARALTK